MDETQADTERALPRALDLEGASNVRDLGGWTTRGGARVCFGRIFRGAALDRLTDSDQQRLAGLGLRAVCDFRGVKERARAPSRLDGLDVAVHSLPIEPRIGASLADILATREATGEDVLSLMRKAYLSYAMDWHAHYRRVFDLLLDEDGAPLLFHCSAGKDRTGFGAALILTALDVPWESVLEDYLATNRLWRAEASLAHALPPPVAEVMLRVHPDLLEYAFEALRAEFGSIEQYLEARLGLDAPRLARLRALLLETPR